MLDADRREPAPPAAHISGEHHRRRFSREYLRSSPAEDWRTMAIGCRRSAFCERLLEELRQQASATADHVAALYLASHTAVRMDHQVDELMRMRIAPIGRSDENSSSIVFRIGPAR